MPNPSSYTQASASADTISSSPYFVGGIDQTPSEYASLLQHLKKPKDLKILFRCCVTTWVATIFIFINPVLEEYGTATFFAALLSFIAPPSGVVFTSVLAGVTAALGMCVAWVWGIITMKAAQATRSTAETNALLAQLGQKVAAHVQNVEQSSGQSQYSSVLIFDGFFLDNRVVITYFCMLGLFIYLVARLRVAAPKLVLFQIFALVVADIFLTIAPLLPTFEGSIAQAIVKPAATAIALFLVTSLLIFPESTSHATMDGFVSILVPMKGFLVACLQNFAHYPVQFNVATLAQTKAGTVAAYSATEANLAFLALDVSVGRWSPDDILSLKAPLREVIVMFNQLVQLQITTSESTGKYERLRDTYDSFKSGKNKETTSKDEKDVNNRLPEHGHHQLMHHVEFAKRIPHQEQIQLFCESMRILSETSGDLLGAMGESLDASVEAISTVNTRRWLGRSSSEQCECMRQRHQQVLDSLQAERKRFTDINSGRIIESHLYLFDERGFLMSKADPLANPVRALIVALVYEEKILLLADALASLLTKIIHLEERRSKVSFWMPTGLQHFFSWAFSTNPSQSAQKEERKEDGNASAQREFDAVRLQSARQRSKFDRHLIGAVHWISSTEGIYALRILVASLAVALPAVIRSSSGFFYRQKGLWAIIMAQTGILPFASDFVFALGGRLIGTVIGGVIGMVMWYCGAGSGPGNPYGMAAVFAVVIPVLMYGRLFAPPQYLQALLIGTATAYLVVAYSWDDTHIPSYGNPGVGYNVFWRRTLLVIIGASAAVIVMFLPRPPSATRDVGEILSRTLCASKDLYALLLTTWAAPGQDAMSVVETALLQNSQLLTSLPGRIAMLRFEFSTSPFNPEVFHKVQKLSTAINQNLFQLFSSTIGLPPDLKERFGNFTGATDDRLVGDIMAVMTLLEQTLQTGNPLPAVLPTPLTMRMLDYSSEYGRGDADLDVLTLDMVRRPEFRRYCVATTAFVGLLGSIDELVIAVKGAVGEEHNVPAWERRIWMEEQGIR